MRPEVEALIVCAKARGGEAAFREVAEALRVLVAKAPEVSVAAVLPGLADALTRAADDLGEIASDRASDAGWALT